MCLLCARPSQANPRLNVIYCNPRPSARFACIDRRQRTQIVHAYHQSTRCFNSKDASKSPIHKSSAQRRPPIASWTADPWGETMQDNILPFSHNTQSEKKKQNKIKDTNFFCTKYQFCCLHTLDQTNINAELIQGILHRRSSHRRFPQHPTKQFERLAGLRINPIK